MPTFYLLPEAFYLLPGSSALLNEAFFYLLVTCTLHLHGFIQTIKAPICIYLSPAINLHIGESAAFWQKQKLSEVAHWKRTLAAAHVPV